MDDEMMVRRDFESPPGRWRCTVPETGVTIHGQFFKELYQKICAHMVANDLPIPPRSTLEDRACRETNPGSSWCGKRPPKPAAGTLPHLTLALAAQFVSTVYEALKAKRLVPLAEAQRRYAVCMTCPLATSISGCMGCHGILKNIDRAFPKNPIPDDPEKRFCGACGCVLKLKVWLPQDVLDRAEKVRPKYWEHCWRNEKADP